MIEYEEIKLLKQSEKSTVLLVREKDGEQIFVEKRLKGQHPIYLELRDCLHPYLPKLYEVIMSEGTTTIIEEYVEGQSLGSTELSEKQLLNSVRELCSVLEFLHGRDIIHRDIKPSNIMYAKDGHIRLIDFDAARMGKDALKQEQDTRLLGTRGYAPPEQYGFAQTDTRADIYLLGITIGQLLGEKAQKYRYQRVIKKCTDLNPDRRFQSVKQVHNALSFPYRNFLYILAAIVAVFILCALIIYPLWKAEDKVVSNLPQIQRQEETSVLQTEELLLFEAQKGEYIIMSQLDTEQDKTANMQVDMTGDGDFVEFSIGYNDDYQSAATTAKSTDGLTPVFGILRCRSFYKEFHINNSFHIKTVSFRLHALTLMLMA